MRLSGLPGAVAGFRGHLNTMSAIVRRPCPLRSGDTVAVVSPCGPVLDQALLDAGIGVLGSWGLDVVEGRHCRAEVGHVAGSDAQRVEDLNAAIADPAVRGLWVTRGGYGLTRIVDRIDWGALAADPKPIVGFSDVTALHVAAWRRVRVVTVHGHFVGRLSVQPEAIRDRLRQVVFGESAPGVLMGTPLAPGRVGPVPLVGGNLTVLAALAGTPDQLRVPGCVVLLEEVSEAPYRVDRALTQLLASGSLAGVAGIAVGTPVACDPPPNRPSHTFDEVVADRLAALGVPVVTDLPIGHMPAQHAVLHGGLVTLDGATGSLDLHDRLPSADPS